jgi:anti-sigma-K factor RskA
MSNNRIDTDLEREHIEELSSAYVLGSLTEDAEGLKEFESLIESGDPLLSQTLEQMLGASVALAMAVPAFEPPASIRASLLENISKTGQSSAPSAQDAKPILSQDAVRLRTRTRYFIGSSILSGLLLCILLGLNVSKSAKLDRSNDLMKSLLKQTDSLRLMADLGASGHPNDSVQTTAISLTKNSPELSRFFAMFGEPDSRLVTLASAPLGASRQHLFFSPKQRTVALMRENLRPLSASKVYELWATVGHKPPVAIGTFTVDGANAPPVFNFPTKLKSADAFSISIEPAGGGNVRHGAVIFTGEVPKSGIN